MNVIHNDGSLFLECASNEKTRSSSTTTQSKKGED